MYTIGVDLGEFCCKSSLSLRMWRIVIFIPPVIWETGIGVCSVLECGWIGVACWWIGGENAFLVAGLCWGEVMEWDETQETLSEARKRIHAESDSRYAEFDAAYKAAIASKPEGGDPAYFKAALEKVLKNFPPLPASECERTSFKHLKDLPESTDPATDLLWVATNLDLYARLRTTRAAHQITMLEKTAPSRLAVTYVSEFSLNPATRRTFLKDCIPKIVKVKADSEKTGELDSHGKKHLEMLDAMVAEMKCPHCGEHLE